MLPVWWDTYGCAETARHLGIGLIGNVGAAPRVEAEQFTQKLRMVLESSTMRAKAAAVGAACKRNGEGRVLAAKVVIDFADAKSIG